MTSHITRMRENGIQVPGTMVLSQRVILQKETTYNGGGEVGGENGRECCTPLQQQRHKGRHDHIEEHAPGPKNVDSGVFVAIRFAVLNDLLAIP